MINMDIILIILRGYICFVFFKSSLVKFKNPYGFMIITEQYKVFPKPILRTIAAVIVTIEISIVIWILVPAFHFLGSIIGIMLQVVFILLLLKNLGRTMERGCGCFQINAPKRITLLHVLFNIKLLIIFFALLFFK